MKKLSLLVIATLLFFKPCFAQWTTSGNNIYNSNSGYVGIGTNSPIAPLQISSTNGVLVNLQNSVATSYTQMMYTATGRTYQIGVGNGSETSYGVANSFYIYDRTSDAIRFVVNSNGNIGVGTANPLSAFQVGSSIATVSLGDAIGSNLNNGTSYLGFNAARNSVAGTWTSRGDGSHNGGSVIYGNVLGDIYFASIPNTGTIDQNLADVAIKSDIKMLISGYDGSVHMKQAYVLTTGWPDYVFDNNYQLLPLAEIKRYIENNHHLPDVPTETQIAKDGINLGEMNKLLMKKVEELTLYIIENDKSIQQSNDTLLAQKAVSDYQKQVLQQQLIRITAQDEKIFRLEKKIDELIASMKNN